MWYFQDVVAALSSFWAKQGCVIASPYDLEKGAGTSNPTTLLRAIGPEPFSAAYIEPCRRPKDGRYGLNPNRLQHYFQYQVILKPSPDNIVDLYLQSLEAIGIDRKTHDIRFVHDDWENPTLGAWGLGWEVWIDGMEDTQFTFFQAAAGIPLYPITGEITYGIERLTMCLQNVNSIFDIRWNEHCTYGDIFHQNEVQWSAYNFEHQDDKMWMRHFEEYQHEAKNLVAKKLPIPAYDFVLKASHAFNMLDAKGVISVSDRAAYIGKIRDITKTVAESYLQFRESLGFPLCKKTTSIPTEISPQPIPTIKNQTEPFLLEIGVEELPAASIPMATELLRTTIKQLLDKENLSYTSISSYGSPRRLSVLIAALQTKKEAKTIRKKGPPLSALWDSSGQITPVGKGFFKTRAIAPPTIEDLYENKIPGLDINKSATESYLFITESSPEISTAAILQEKLPKILSSLEFPKRMRWGSHQLQFIRPIRHIVCLLGSDIVPFTLEHLQSGRTSYGHRQRHGHPISFTNASEYVSVCENASIIVDPERRRERIRIAVEKIELKTGCTAIEKDRMINETAFLTEMPDVASTSFDPSLLDAPCEILSSEMIEHQKYIPLRTPEGTLSNHFIFITDNTPSDIIAAGNVKVLTARLRDGSFLWKEDVKTSLHSFREKLRIVSFQKGLGSLYDKTVRLENLSKILLQYFPSVSEKDAAEAATLCKADLVSQVVGEFPHLQGLIGAYLAKAANLPPAIATAIEEHYYPKQENGTLPTTPLSSLIALSDKIDTLAGFFALGVKPTSSNDPFALRRAAIGIVRIILHEKLHLDLKNLFLKALSLYSEPFAQQETIPTDLLSYIHGRLKPLMIEEGIFKEIVDAVVVNTTTDLYDSYLRAKALFAIQTTPACRSFVEVLKRCIGQIDKQTTTEISPHLLEHTSEKDFYTKLHIAKESCLKAEIAHDWNLYLQNLLTLQEPIAHLFESVRICDENPSLQKNRKALLAQVIELVERLASPKHLIEILSN